MAENKQEKDLPHVVPHYVRALDLDGNSGKTTIESISTLIGIDSFRYSIAPNSIVTIPVKPGIYIAYTDINPEVVVFCTGTPGRADYGIHVLLGSTSGAFNFTGTGNYINITQSEDGNTLKIVNRYAAGAITVVIKRIVL